MVLTKLKKIIRSRVYNIKKLIECKDLHIQKVDKGNVVIDYRSH